MRQKWQEHTASHIGGAGITPNIGSTENGEQSGRTSYATTDGNPGRPSPSSSYPETTQSNCLGCQEFLGDGLQCWPLLTMLLRMVKSLRMEAFSASFLGLPVASSRWWKVRITGICRLATNAPCVEHRSHPGGACGDGSPAPLSRFIGDHSCQRRYLPSAQRLHFREVQ